VSRRLPLLPTALVLAAVALMIGLGVWQLHRLKWKESLLARYGAAGHITAEVPFPRDAAAAEPVLYRRSRVDCRSVEDATAISGHNAAGAPGVAHVVRCRLADGSQARVVLGWSPDPRAPDWRGGLVTGTIAPGPRLVADPPLAGLAANERPDPAQIPNNHFSYAVQWFLFAATALVIYALALRGRWRRGTVVEPRKPR
jgi:cytochrome oxidase assembly protein ShyY1